MSRMLKVVSLSAAIFCFGLMAFGQDSPSLGDAARQARQQKQQKDAQTKAQDKDKDSDSQTAKTPKVITNDEIPGHAPSKLPHNGDAQPKIAAYTPPDGEWKLSADQWKTQIQSVKGYIASLQGNIDRLNDSIHYASANCVSNCVQWNERQQQKQMQVEQMKSQLDDTQKRLEDLQDAARQQGYGSSVYDP
jgi:hypothetical protein